MIRCRMWFSVCNSRNSLVSKKCSNAIYYILYIILLLYMYVDIPVCYVTCTCTRVLLLPRFPGASSGAACWYRCTCTVVWDDFHPVECVVLIHGSLRLTLSALLSTTLAPVNTLLLFWPWTYCTAFNICAQCNNTIMCLYCMYNTVTFMNTPYLHWILNSGRHYTVQLLVPLKPTLTQTLTIIINNNIYSVRS